ncbi:hypothetical protein BUALT_Bualt07G0078400 [Buddleja alternifolia]|uniref:COBRA C-terminal domain-containing protein n=1 Tax=Buddleja alternifolia TaxID=168488 RepID=A0AAV6XFY8_9LAMI|nr:hypothetical protein BUALT_Bualt07G0078400 [Buddleja alternifolia]
MGGEATEQRDCSIFKGNNIPHSCTTNPTIVDLLPGTPYHQQIAHCCKGGVISSWVQDPANALSSFQLTVGQAGTSRKTVKVPKNLTLQTVGPELSIVTYFSLFQKLSSDSLHLASVVPSSKKNKDAPYDTGMLWGVKFYNDLLMQAGPLGNIQSELLFKKRITNFTLDFPQRKYFNGGECVMPPPGGYPYIANECVHTVISMLDLVTRVVASLVFFLAPA